MKAACKVILALGVAVLLLSVPASSAFEVDDVQCSPAICCRVGATASLSDQSNQRPVRLTHTSEPAALPSAASDPWGNEGRSNRALVLLLCVLRC
jgi:hypothetical protein